MKCSCNYRHHIHAVKDMIAHVVGSRSKEEVETLLDPQFALRGGAGIFGSQQVVDGDSG